MLLVSTSPLVANVVALICPAATLGALRMICPAPLVAMLMSPLVTELIVLLKTCRKPNWVMNPSGTVTLPDMVCATVVMGDCTFTTPVPWANMFRLALVAGDCILSVNTVP